MAALVSSHRWQWKEKLEVERQLQIRRISFGRIIRNVHRQPILSQTMSIKRVKLCLRMHVKQFFLGVNAMQASRTPPQLCHLAQSLRFKPHPRNWRPWLCRFSWCFRGKRRKVSPFFSEFRMQKRRNFRAGWMNGGLFTFQEWCFFFSTQQLLTKNVAKKQPGLSRCHIQPPFPSWDCHSFNSDPVLTPASLERFRWDSKPSRVQKKQKQQEI